MDALNSQLTKLGCATVSADSAKPHLGLFASVHEAGLAQQNITIPKDFGRTEVLIQINNTAGDDPFCDTGPELVDFDPSEPCCDLPEASQAKIQRLGYGVRCASHLLGRQHRRHVFSMTVSGAMVRFIRWDRAGAIVSRAFDCSEDPDTLRLFLWRLEHLDAARRGYDTTVEVGSAEVHGTAFAAAVEDRVCFELGIERQDVDAVRKALELHYDPERVSIVSVPDGESVSSHCVSRSVVAPHSVVGRGTGGYWGMDTVTQEVCFAKDIWRGTVGKWELEGDIVRELKESGARNVPEIVCHGDVVSGE